MHSGIAPPQQKKPPPARPALPAARHRHPRADRAARACRAGAPGRRGAGMSATPSALFSTALSASRQSGSARYAEMAAAASSPASACPGPAPRHCLAHCSQASHGRSSADSPGPNEAQPNSAAGHHQQSCAPGINRCTAAAGAQPVAHSAGARGVRDPTQRGTAGRCMRQGARGARLGQGGVVVPVPGLQAHVAQRAPLVPRLGAAQRLRLLRRLRPAAQWVRYRQGRRWLL